MDISNNQMNLKSIDNKCLPMNTSFLSASTGNAYESDFNDSFCSSKSHISSNISDSELTRSSESDSNNSICFNRSILVMLQCEENEKKSKVTKIFDKNKSILEPIHDFTVIEQINVKNVKKIVENNFLLGGLKYCLIDVRFPYEYKGGHIKGAINLYTPLEIFQYFFGPFELKSYTTRENLELVVNNIVNTDIFSSNLRLIFHCEFSSVRGPRMAEELRCIDRFANLCSYPNLFYPVIYIMKGGYREFFSNYKELCEPINYVKMDPDDYSDITNEFAASNEIHQIRQSIDVPAELRAAQIKQIEFHKNIVDHQLFLLTEIKQSIISHRKQNPSQ